MSFLVEGFQRNVWEPIPDAGKKAIAVGSGFATATIAYLAVNSIKEAISSCAGSAAAEVIPFPCVYTMCEFSVCSVEVAKSALVSGSALATAGVAYLAAKASFSAKPKSE